MSGKIIIPQLNKSQHSKFIKSTPLLFKWNISEAIVKWTVTIYACYVINSSLYQYKKGGKNA